MGTNKCRHTLFEIFDPSLPFYFNFWEIPLPPKWVTSFMDGRLDPKNMDYEIIYVAEFLNQCDNYQIYIL